MDKPVLITGMSGLIGSAVQNAMASEYELRALNRREVEGVPTTRADLVDLDAIRPAFDGESTRSFTWRQKQVSISLGKNCLIRTLLVPEISIKRPSTLVAVASYSRVVGQPCQGTSKSNPTSRLLKRAMTMPPIRGD